MLPIIWLFKIHNAFEWSFGMVLNVNLRWISCREIDFNDIYALNVHFDVKFAFRVGHCQMCKTLQPWKKVLYFDSCGVHSFAHICLWFHSNEIGRIKIKNQNDNFLVENSWRMWFTRMSWNYTVDLGLPAILRGFISNYW